MAAFDHHPHQAEQRFVQITNTQRNIIQILRKFSKFVAVWLEKVREHIFSAFSALWIIIV